MPRSRVILIGIFGLLALFFALLFLGIIPGLQEDAKSKTPLTFWGVFDSKDVIDSVSASVPGYTITYRQFSPQTYESELLNALAAGNGPDVFMFHNSWLPKHADKIAPVTARDLSIGSLRDYFPTVVEQDFAPDRQTIYALPLYMDTLALLYNRDIFDTKGVPLPPKNWSEFLATIPKLREIDSTGRITKAAAAIGGSGKSINRASDLLSEIMLQAGVSMTSNDYGRATFSTNGLQPLLFYTQFANSASEAYTWSDAFGNSIDSFADGSTAMMFNYSYQIPILLQKNPFLSIGVAPFPQPAGAEANPVNFANYWGVAVASQTRVPTEAWQFILKLTTDESIAGTYANATGRLPALKSLISARLNDPIWGVFANAALSARSWPQIDNNAVDQIFSNLIENVITGKSDAARALQEAERSVTSLMERQRSTTF